MGMWWEANAERERGQSRGPFTWLDARAVSMVTAVERIQPCGGARAKAIGGEADPSPPLRRGFRMTARVVWRDLQRLSDASGGGILAPSDP